jgi:Flp pilus assembly pilin Flp
MRALINVVWSTASVRALAVDEAGQDLIEYALLSGAVGIASVALYPAIVDGMRNLFTNTQSAAQDIWRPCAPAPASCP